MVCGEDGGDGGDDDDGGDDEDIYIFYTICLSIYPSNR